ncbi:MAG: FAD:protein FMN transferase [Reinekea forsetii]|nr:FAD:protein FMN transferase [Reinekea forsetii]
MSSDKPESAHGYRLKAAEQGRSELEWVVEFAAMASPCQILLHGVNRPTAERLAALACTEVHRIEQKYSRYRTANSMATLNHSAGGVVSIDTETMALLAFADQAYQLSDGLFDISSGILGRVWHFDGSARLPEQSAIDALLPLIDWPAVRYWHNADGTQAFQMPAGMALDFGGLGKEYAADRALAAMSQSGLPGLGPMLVNLGGDIATNGVLFPEHSWQIGVEPGTLGGNGGKIAAFCLTLPSGALATSGDARKFMKKEARIYGHILNPKTGWPVAGGPRSVSVCANTCLESGLLSTLALLQGSQAADFLDQQGRQYWLQW